ncbi:uncharacterized protein Z518_03964 [Rhinocladiella mackenziei CBS 650.93]|uniref:peptidylprolyl isomerase n=1 Tax=Rhinocladiella mackenziei CBS 650.93 TaxID=1442369 RepID=A0A0D2JA50_9EURO|nr:uncharacterized protein Z518_03964 [Rhinocladiella mackenziei CBS 650.93]KIX05990.1 hypothetical protein Z518_03964 [Rhinocladiella mackenziei CBS 650.93]
MAPYKIVLIPPKGDRLDLVLPFDGSSTFQDLTAAVIRRASKYCSLPSNIRQDHLKLCLGSEEGFLVDPEDVVQDVITTSDVLFIVFFDGPSGRISAQFKDDDLSSAEHALQIRVVTPEIAERNLETRHMTSLQEGRHYPPSTTLAQLKSDIAHHLHLPSVPSDDSWEKMECNCKLAELLVKRGIWEKITCNGHTMFSCAFQYSAPTADRNCAKCSQPLATHTTMYDGGICQAYVLRRIDLPCGHTIHSKCLSAGEDFDCPQSCYSTNQPQPLSSRHLLVVSGHGNVERLEMTSNHHSALMGRLTERFGENFTDEKAVFYKGGFGDENMYTRLPVVAVCSSHRHKHDSDTIPAGENLCRVKLDLHTIEGPINTANLNLTMKDMRLADLAVNGVLTIYAVHWTSTGSEKHAKSQDAMFTAASHWKLPTVQSDRGMAAALASLRVFAHIIGSEDFDDVRQNEILKAVHLLTRFPPAVRATHILMDGKTLQSNESAALVQSLAAVAEELIPLSLIGSDVRRRLEGARLVLGLILHRVRKAETVKGETMNSASTSSSKFPYIAAYHTIDLRDIKTLEPVTNPVLTNFGLADRSVFNALSASSALKHSPSCYLTDCSEDDSRRIRVALLYGGVALETPYYEADAVSAALELHTASASSSLDLKELSADIPYLASLCEETKLVVVAPRHLSNARAPCLTLDRHGNMAVYTGRAACAAPGHDHAVFRPLTGVEENADVNIVTQLLEPILRAREQDGTNVFDLFSATYRRKDATPTELVVFCVDCSYSMNGSSDFAELNDDDSLPSSSTVDGDVVLDDEDDTDVTLEEIKSWVCDHEAYEDILHIVHHYPQSRTRDAAQEVIEYLRGITSRHLANLAQKQRGISRWATSTYSRNNTSARQEMNSLRRTLTGLNVHEQSLCDFLIFTARNPHFESKEFRWLYGDDLPSAPTSEEDQNAVDMGDFCVIPQEFICPISQVVFEDPVDTSDGFTFDRKAIERWYRIRRSSPLSGLPIENITLRHKQVLANQIKSWVRAEDVMESLSSTPKRTRLSMRQSKTVIDFVAPTVRFTRQVPATATLLDLHKIAFRGMRGLYPRFSLYVGGTYLPSSEENMVRRGVSGNQTITISPNHTPTAENPGALGGSEEMCLIRVYRGGRFSGAKFNFWVPLHSEFTMTLILFRNWRYLVQCKARPYSNHDMTVWSGLRDGGDNACIGHDQDAWASLSSLLRDLSRTEIKENEALFESLSDSARNRNAPHANHSFSGTGQPNRETSGDGQYRRCRVLKVSLYDYVDPEIHEQQKLAKQKTLTRLAVTKQVFSAFINRLIAYNFPTNVGLVTFGTDTKISQKLTDVIENFRQAVDRMDANGNTVLWDAIDLAADHLVEVGRSYGTIKKRIICLSDGEDTSSGKKVEDVCRRLAQQEIVVDSVCIGEEDNSELRTLSYRTGGYKFVPNSIEEASALCELEPVLSIHERPPVSRPTHQWFSQSTRHAIPDPVTRDQYPARKTHKNLNDTFVRIGRFENTVHRRLRESSSSSGSSTWSRRLLLEIRDIATHPHPSYDVYVSENNMGFWKIVLQGPSESAYASGAFILYLDMGEDYPRRPPSGRFVTPIFHPNVNRHGRICHSIFDRNWTVDTSNKQVLDTVFSLLLVPEFTDPINTIVTLNYYWDEVAFREEVQKHIEKHANKSRSELGRDIVGE